MAEKKRQKVLLTVLAVCVLGAGGAWVAVHGWGGSDSGRTRPNSVQRKIRETPPKGRVERPGRDNPKGRVADANRKTRELAHRDPTGRKERPGRRSGSGTKKKEIVPVS